MPNLTPHAIRLSIDGQPITANVAYEWRCATDTGEVPAGHAHTIECLWVWHDCATPLSETSVAPGEPFGWRPTGVGAHTLVAESPLTLTASLWWPDCCGLHGFITDGAWIQL